MIMKKIYFAIIALMATLAVSAQSTKKYVDLALPSGTLWATCNVGASKPEEYGDYFAWGETKPKENYDWSTYKWRDGSSDKQTKYCASGIYHTVDKTELDPEDDAATANWGSNWQMPSLDQIKELYNSSYTITEWTTQNGVKGYKITSKKNGKSLFLPAAGFRDRRWLSTAGSHGSYWSRSLYKVYNYYYDYAYYLLFDLAYLGWSYGSRYYGYSVRPVRSKEKVTTSINSVVANQKATKNGKFISGGNLVIVKDGKKYNANGMEIR